MCSRRNSSASLLGSWRMRSSCIRCLLLLFAVWWTATEVRADGLAPQGQLMLVVDGTTWKQGWDAGVTWTEHFDTGLGGPHYPLSFDGADTWNGGAWCKSNQNPVQFAFITVSIRRLKSDEAAGGWWKFVAKKGEATRTYYFPVVAAYPLSGFGDQQMVTYARSAPDITVQALTGVTFQLYGDIGAVSTAATTMPGGATQPGVPTSQPLHEGWKKTTRDLTFKHTGTLNGWVEDIIAAAEVYDQDQGSKLGHGVAAVQYRPDVPGWNTPSMNEISWWPAEAHQQGGQTLVTGPLQKVWDGAYRGALAFGRFWRASWGYDFMGWVIVILAFLYMWWRTARLFA